MTCRLALILLVLQGVWNGATAAESTPEQSALVQAPFLEAKNLENSIHPPTTYRFGITTAVTVPQPLTVGVLAIPSYDPDLAFYVEGGYFKYDFKGRRSVRDWAAKVGARYHPFSNGFYLGLEFGYRHVGATVDISNFKSDDQPLANSASVAANALVFGILAGWEWKLSQNVALGIDLGLQAAPIHWGNVRIFPVSGAGSDTDLSVDSSDALGRISSIPIPQIALFRFIWYL